MTSPPSKTAAATKDMAHFAHERKTPINHIIGSCDLLQEEAEDGGLGGYLPDLRRIQAAGRELLAFFNENLTGDREKGQGLSLDQLQQLIAGC